MQSAHPATRQPPASQFSDCFRRHMAACLRYMRARVCAGEAGGCEAADGGDDAGQGVPGERQLGRACTARMHACMPACPHAWMDAACTQTVGAVRTGTLSQHTRTCVHAAPAPALRLRCGVHCIAGGAECNAGGLHRRHDGGAAGRGAGLSGPMGHACKAMPGQCSWQCSCTCLVSA